MMSKRKPDHLPIFTARPRKAENIQELVAIIVETAGQNLPENLEMRRDCILNMILHYVSTSMREQVERLTTEEQNIVLNELSQSIEDSLKLLETGSATVN
jgi:hypothetical protein